MMGAPLAAGRFALSRWFAWLALLAIAAIAVASVALLSWFVTQRMLWQEASLTRDFVHSLVQTEKPLQAFLSGGLVTPAEPDADAALQHLAALPQVLRCNVFDAQRRLAWSSDPRRLGERFAPNDDLAQALQGSVVIQKKAPHAPQHGQADGRPAGNDFFLEIYVPLRLKDGGPVLGVIEFYKHPKGLIALLDELLRYTAAGAVLAGALLFAALFGLVHRADRLLAQQQQQLVQAETLATVGEMSSVVAHGIRNPLAVIRSSAELMLESARHGPVRDALAEQAAHDIIEQSDRLGQWLKDLLAYSQGPEARVQALALVPVLQAALAELQPEAARRGVGLLQGPGQPGPAPVRADALGLQQVLRTVMLNAVEATPRGGQVTLGLAEEPPPGFVRVQVHDTGPGLTAEQLARVGRPFHTTKPQGLGVGLALARRVLERSGARLQLSSAPGQGTTVHIDLPRA